MPDDGRLFCTPVLAAALCVLSAADGAAQAFVCAEASNSTEKEICNSPDLGALDNGMADAYKVAVGTVRGSDLQRLRDDQRAWLKTRDACDGSWACISEAYIARLSRLTQNYSIFQSWVGTFDGPFDEMQLSVSASGPDAYTVTFEGAAADYTCGPLTGAGTVGKTGLTVTHGGAEILALQALGTGVFLPPNSINAQLKAKTCGIAAPDPSGMFYRRQ